MLRAGHTIWLLLATLLAGFPAFSRAAEPEPPATAAKGQETEGEAAGPDLEPFLGTWLCREIMAPDTPGVEPYPVERHLLFSVRNDQLRVKSVDYLPELRTFGDVSDWNGRTVVDRWNTSSLKVTPRPDGTLFVSLSGTNGIGPAAARAIWWAVGTLTPGEDEEGPFLRLVTTEGYAPSSKGNAWKPLERIYRLVSREVDPRLARAHR